ncbi:MAG: class I SAM-dependent methyltransferase [Terriglobia bacterium]|jgi:ubiquinone/menaquinone biosynthesis C-methylase UbiE
MNNEGPEISEKHFEAGWSKRLHAWMLSKGSAKYERAIAAHKQRLLGSLEGDVLEIGPGGGVNLDHFAPHVRWTGVEPNPFMHSYLRKKALSLGREIDVRMGRAEELGFPSQAFDAVVTTLVLCSVADQVRVLEEIKRVLRPGGKYVFIEHVVAPEGTFTRRAQRWIRPVWRVVGDGCSPERATWRAIEAAGFQHVEIEHFRVPFPIVGPHIAGFATKVGN